MIFIESLMVALFCLVSVFTVLLLLCFAIKLFSHVLAFISHRGERLALADEIIDSIPTMQSESTLVGNSSINSQVRQEKKSATTASTTIRDSSGNLLSVLNLKSIRCVKQAPVSAAEVPDIAPQSKFIDIISSAPATVLDIMAYPGKEVKMGEALILLETMKMENELTAPVDGIITDVLIRRGTSVVSGDILIKMV